MAKLWIIFIFIFYKPNATFSKLRFSGDAYEDLLVAVSPEVPQANSEQLIENIKAMITEGSSALNKATKGMSYIKTVKILVPNDWGSVTTDFASWEVFEDSDVRVELKNSMYGDMPHTTNMEECGQQGNPQNGQYVSLSLPYLNNMEDLSQIYGSKGKIFVNLWAQYRYGVFEEHGYPEDPRFPFLYYSKKNSTEILPNACSNIPLEGTLIDSQIPNHDCSYNESTGLMDNNCMFVANKSQPGVTSSIMSLTYIEKNELFCDESNHNKNAPNKHNLLCRGKSVWEVISESQDFYGKYQRKHPISLNTAPSPTFSIIRQSFQKFILLLDVSGSMGGDNLRPAKLPNMIDAAKYWIYDKSELLQGSFLGIFSFSTATTKIASLRQIGGAGDRQALAKSIESLQPGGGTEIGTGLLQSVQEMKTKGPGGVIILITDGEEEHIGPSMVSNQVLGALEEQEVKVFTMAFGNSASGKLEQLALATGGKTFFIAPDGGGFDDAFSETTTVQPGSTLGKVQIAVGTMVLNMNQQLTKTGNFSVDKSIGKNLKMELKIKIKDQGENVHAKDFISGELYSKENHHSEIDWDTQSIGSVTVDMADVDVWTWSVTGKNPPQIHTPIIFVYITITSERRSDNTFPVRTECTLRSNEVNVDYKLKATAKVTQGGEKVLYANVRARLERPGSAVDDDLACEIPLRDDGYFADQIANNGIYANYYDFRNCQGFSDVTQDTRFNLICEVVGDEDSFTPGNGTQWKMAPSEGGVPICCGSVVPDPKVKNPTGFFNRRTAGGSLKISPSSNPTPDPDPPATVSDLTLDVELISSGEPLIHIKFHSPGNNFLTGTAKKYIIQYSKQVILDEEDFNTATSITNDMITSGSLSPLPPGTLTILISSVDEINSQDTVYFALKTENVEGLLSSMSNVPFIFIPSGQPVPVPPRPTTSAVSIRLLIGAHEKDVPDCECSDECQTSLISNCLYDDFTCSTTCYCSCQSIEAATSPFTIHGGTPFSSFTLERRILGDVSEKEPCPFCPCQQKMDHIECDDSSCIQTCTCMCDRVSSSLLSEEIDNQPDPASIVIEFYEFLQDDDYVPETFCMNQSLPYKKVDCIDGKCILLNVCITNSMSFIESGLELYWVSDHYSINNAIYTTYAHVDQIQEDVMNFCPTSCEKEESRVCDNYKTICTTQLSCFCFL